MEERNYEQRREKLLQMLESRRLKSLQNELEDMNEFDIAEFMTELGEDDTVKMMTVFRLLSKERGAEVFAELDAPEQQEIINSITDKELSYIVEDMYVDDAVDMMEELPANIVKRVMRTATPETRALINQYLKYPENSVGSIMTAEFVDLKKYMNVRESIARIRRDGRRQGDHLRLLCHQRTPQARGRRHCQGPASARRRCGHRGHHGHATSSSCARLTTGARPLSASPTTTCWPCPVVDKEDRLVGIVTVDDVIDVLEEEATEDFDLMSRYFTLGQAVFPRHGVAGAVEETHTLAACSSCSAPPSQA